MQWEVSANGLLTASRVAHYQDSQPGSCSGVWSHLPLPSFGVFCYYGVLDDLRVNMVGTVVLLHILRRRRSSDWEVINNLRTDLLVQS